MAAVRRLVLDVLEPHDSSLIEFAERLAETGSVAGVTAPLVEREREVRNVELTFEGEDVERDAIEGTIERLGGTAHSVGSPVVTTPSRIAGRHGTPDDP